MPAPHPKATHRRCGQMATLTGGSSGEHRLRYRLRGPLSTRMPALCAEVGLCARGGGAELVGPTGEAKVPRRAWRLSSPEEPVDQLREGGAPRMEAMWWSGVRLLVWEGWEWVVGVGCCAAEEVEGWRGLQEAGEGRWEASICRSQTRPVRPSRRAAMAKRWEEVSMLTARTRRGQMTLVRGVRWGLWEGWVGAKFDVEGGWSRRR